MVFGKRMAILMTEQHSLNKNSFEGYL